jgi:hypothetical protein
MYNKLCFLCHSLAANTNFNLLVLEIREKKRIITGYLSAYLLSKGIQIKLCGLGFVRGRLRNLNTYWRIFP